jgi:hypothetical protein
MNAIPLSAGVFDRKDLKALRPPAEAPMPTIKPRSGGFELVLASARPLSREGPVLAFAEARLPLGLFCTLTHNANPRSHPVNASLR